MGIKVRTLATLVGHAAVPPSRRLPLPALPPPTPKRCSCGRGFITSGNLVRHQTKCGWHLIRRAMAADAARTRGESTQ